MSLEPRGKQESPSSFTTSPNELEIRLHSQWFFDGFFGQESYDAFLGTFFRVTKRLPTAVLTLGVFWSVINYILTAL